MTYNRCTEPGYHRIGRICSASRRSLWIRESSDAIELCAGREGDDAYIRITPANPQWRELEDVLSRARFAAEWEDGIGMALEQDALASQTYAAWSRWDSGDSEPSDAVNL